jgi:ribosomal protein S27AE
MIAPAAIGVSMMHLGLLARTHGSCPICGSDVARTHAFDGDRLRDAYSCYRCGPTEYAVRVGVTPVVSTA